MSPETENQNMENAEWKAPDSKEAGSPGPANEQRPKIDLPKLKAKAELKALKQQKEIRDKLGLNKEATSTESTVEQATAINEALVAAEANVDQLKQQLEAAIDASKIPSWLLRGAPGFSGEVKRLKGELKEAEDKLKLERAKDEARIAKEQANAFAKAEAARMLNQQDEIAKTKAADLLRSQEQNIQARDRQRDRENPAIAVESNTVNTDEGDIRKTL